MAELTKAKQRVWIYPAFDCNCDCSEDEDESNVYRLSYEIPGVKKEDIHLKIIKSAVRLIAHKGEIDYVNEFSFQCDVDVKNSLAEYENGILTIDLPYNCPDPFKEAEFAKIN